MMYIESTGEQFIETGMTPDFADEDEFVFKFALTKNIKVQLLWATSGDIHQLPYTGALRLDQTDERPSIPVSSGEVYKYKTVGKTVFLNDETYAGAWTNGATAPMTLLAKRKYDGYETFASARIYEVLYVANGVTVLNLLPVLDPEGRPGLLNTVSGAMLYNAGSGEFLYSAE